MDYFGRQCGICGSQSQNRFQSFWFNGLLWKPRRPRSRTGTRKSFNPSGSMDYFGRLFGAVALRIESQFQSFWFNGLLWKLASSRCSSLATHVSILLVQWITLEEISVNLNHSNTFCFNPSGSMDYFGRGHKHEKQRQCGKFQSFWFNGLLWKRSIMNCLMSIN